MRKYEVILDRVPVPYHERDLARTIARQLLPERREELLKSGADVGERAEGVGEAVPEAATPAAPAEGQTAQA